MAITAIRASACLIRSKILSVSNGGRPKNLGVGRVFRQRNRFHVHTIYLPGSSVCRSQSAYRICLKPQYAAAHPKTILCVGRPIRTQHSAIYRGAAVCIVEGHTADTPRTLVVRRKKPRFVEDSTIQHFVVGNERNRFLLRSCVCGLPGQPFRQHRKIRQTHNLAVLHIVLNVAAPCFQVVRPILRANKDCQGTRILPPFQRNLPALVGTDMGSSPRVFRVR